MHPKEVAVSGAKTKQKEIAALSAALLALIDAPVVTPTYKISKSKFVAGMQCLKRLYLQVHRPELATDTNHRIKEQGTEVGILARRAFPDGVLVDTPSYEFERATQETARLMADPRVNVIFEAAFFADGVRVRIDVLVRKEGGWEVSGIPDDVLAYCIGEVKSSTKVKDYHFGDVSIQAYVLRKAGVKVAHSVIVHLNPDYVYPGGEHDLTKLFVIEPVEPRPDYWIKQQLCEQFRILENPAPPAVNVGRQCTNPHECEFRSHCYGSLPADDLAYLPISKSNKWDKIANLRKQASSILDIQPNGNFTYAERDKIKAAQAALRTGRIVIQPGLAAVLAGIRTPLAFVDFETLAVAIPRYPGMKPWQAVPMQYSVHMLKRGGLLEHREFLAETDGSDPRIAFIENLLRDIAEAQTVAIWSPYEKTVLTKLAEVFPKYADRINAVIAKLWDMCRTFKDNVYHAEFRGSFSIKTVLPALLPELSYDDLKIAGLAASGDSVLPAWNLMSDPSASLEERQRIRQELLRYCERDTIGMYYLLTALVEAMQVQAAG